VKISECLSICGMSAQTLCCRGRAGHIDRTYLGASADRHFRCCRSQMLHLKDRAVATLRREGQLPQERGAARMSQLPRSSANSVVTEHAIVLKFHDVLDGMDRHRLRQQPGDEAWIICAAEKRARGKASRRRRQGRGGIAPSVSEAGIERARKGSRALSDRTDPRGVV